MKKLTTLAALILSLTLAANSFAIIETPSGAHTRATDEESVNGNYPGSSPIVENPSGTHNKATDEDSLGGWLGVAFGWLSTVLP